MPGAFGLLDTTLMCGSTADRRATEDAALEAELAQWMPTQLQPSPAPGLVEEVTFGEVEQSPY
jgi:hypothetical protein